MNFITIQIFCPSNIGMTLDIKPQVFMSSVMFCFICTYSPKKPDDDSSHFRIFSGYVFLFCRLNFYCDQLLTQFIHLFNFN